MSAPDMVAYWGLEGLKPKERAGHTAYLLRTHFRDLCREIGEAKARAETLEMIDDETEGSSRHG